MEVMILIFIIKRLQIFKGYASMLKLILKKKIMYTMSYLKSLEVAAHNKALRRSV